MEKQEIFSEGTCKIFKNEKELRKRNSEVVDRVKEFKHILRFKDLKRFVKKYEASIDEDTPVFLQQIQDKHLLDPEFNWIKDTLFFVPNYIPEGAVDPFVQSAANKLNQGMLDVLLVGTDISFENGNSIITIDV